jgi:D-alanine-D-alanine ligase
MPNINKSKLKLYQGQEGLKKIFNDVIGTSKKEILLYTNCEKERDIFDPKEHQKFIQARRKQGIRIRVLAVDSPRARAMQKQDKIMDRQTRLLPRDIFFTSETYIYEGKVALVAYQDEIFGFIAESPEFAQSQRAIFEGLWTLSTKNAAVKQKKNFIKPQLKPAPKIGVSSGRKKVRIGVIFGGLSSEKEVSLNSGRNVYYNINKEKYESLPIYWDSKSRFWLVPEDLIIRNTTFEIEKNLDKARKLRFEDLKKIMDLAFLTTHGKYGDDGALQGLLEWLRIPHTGANTLGAALGMDKWMQRKLMKQAKINLPKYEILAIDQWQASKSKAQEQISKRLKYPLVVKPAREGSSFGVSLISRKSNFLEATSEAFSYDNIVLFEEYLTGREFSCIVIETLNGTMAKALPPTETKHKGSLFTYDEKYLPGAAAKETPMKVRKDTIKKIQQQSIDTFLALGFRDYARIDGFVVPAGKQEKVLITDPNAAASTGMAASSFTWHQAAEIGMNTSDFISYLIDLACHRITPINL